LEPEVYRERYIEVTRTAIGFAISEGKTDQARQWLDYLKNELGVDPGELELEELKLASALGDESASDELARSELNSGDERLRLRGADALVLAGAPEAEPVCRAIRHLCRSEWSEMRDALQGVGRKSAFAHWRLFLRGCAAYYQNDAPLAASCFSKLPAGTIPARKAAAFGGWRGKDAGSFPESMLKERCHLIGESEMADALVKSQHFWTKGMYAKAYQAMKHSGARFPDLKVSLAGQVSHFFQHADVSLNRTERGRWLEFAASAMSKRSFNTEADNYVLANTLIHGGDYECDAIWEIYRRGREATRGKNARFVALCYVIRATSDLILECECEECVQFGHECAIFKLEAAIQADPGYEPAYLKLLDSYRVLRKKSERNKLLDKMSTRFPESKTSLLAAGRACLDRKAHAKGLAYLEKAREAAPLDGEVRAEIRRGLVAKAVGHYAKGTPPQFEKARESFELLLKETPRNPDFGETEEIVYLRWSVLEELAVEGKESQKDDKRLLAKGIDSHVAEFVLAFYREHHAPQLHGKRAKSIPMVEPRGEKTLAQALQMLRFLLNGMKSERGKGIREEWLDFLEDYIDDALPELTKKDRGIAVEMYRLLQETHHFWTRYPADLIDQWRELDKDDPLFTVWFWQDIDEEPTQEEIDKTRKEAEKRGDRMALTALDAYLKVLRENNAEISDEDAAIFGKGGMTLDQAEMMAAVLKPMAPAERIRFLMGQGASREEAEVISSVVDTFGSAAPPEGLPSAKESPAKPKPQPRPAAKPSDPDPNQFDLPF